MVLNTIHGLAFVQRLHPDGNNLVIRPLTITILSRNGHIEVPVAADSLILRFSRPERQMLRIAASDGALTLIADDSGTIFVRIDKKLVEENPMMELSEPALDALPAISTR